MAEILKNRYRIIQCIGSGGCAKTFLAEDTDAFNSRCVVKQFEPATQDPRSYNIIRDRFQREALILKKISENCRQIPGFLAYFTEGQQFYVVQEWIDGLNLSQKVRRDGRFCEDELRRFLFDVLPILKYVHSQNIIHRDLKPENIMLRSSDDKPVLIDFGAVKEIVTTIYVDGVPSSLPSIAIGSPGYMPREQMAGRPVFASDIYSLGLTAIFLVTGQYPQELTNLKTGQILWREQVPNISDDLAAILNKAVEPATEKRYQTTDEMLARLQEPPPPVPKTEVPISSLFPEEHKMVTPIQVPPPRYKRWIGFSILAVLFLLCAVLVIKAVLDKGPPPPTQAEAGAPPPKPPEPLPKPTEPLCKGPLNQNVLNQIKRRGYLVLGVQHNAYPMNTSPQGDEIEPGGKGEKQRRIEELKWDRDGFDYQIASMIAERLGLHAEKKVKAREVTKFIELFCLLNRKEDNNEFSVDIIMSGIAIDELYNDTIAWSKGYVDFGYALIAKKSSHIESLDDCKNKRIGIVEGDNVVEKYVKDKLPNVQIVVLSDADSGWTNEAINKEKKVDAIIYDFPFAVSELGEINRMKKEEGITGETLEIKDADLPDSHRTYNIGVAKGNDDLLEEINEAIDYIKKTQTSRYIALVHEFMKPPKGAIKETHATGRKYEVKPGDYLERVAERNESKIPFLCILSPLSASCSLCFFGLIRRLASLSLQCLSSDC